MKRSGFTMIELIFVIVILGILASVAIPKLAATRDDAKIAAVAQQVQSAIGEIPAYVTAKGTVDGLTDMSQVLSQLNEQNKLSKTSNTYDGTAQAGSADKTVYLGTLNDSGTMKDCFQFDVNNTHLKISHKTADGKVCTGVQARIAEGTFQIGGQSVKF